MSGGLRAGTVRAVIRRGLKDIKFCYMAYGLSSNPQLQGMVKVEFWIQLDGHVGKVSILHTSLQSPATEKCIRSAVARWRFPPPGKRLARVIYPFYFRPRP